MPNIALIPSAATSIAALTAVIDGFPTGTHKLESTTGGEPLEDGRSVTDHVVAREERLVLNGWVSDFNGGNRPGEAWETIRRLHKSVTTLTVVTEYGTYPEMIIYRAEAPQESRGLRFTLELHEILRSGVTDSELPPQTLSGPAAGRSGEVERGRVSLGDDFAVF